MISNGAYTTAFQYLFNEAAGHSDNKLSPSEIPDGAGSCYDEPCYIIADETGVKNGEPFERPGRNVTQGHQVKSYPIAAKALGILPGARATGLALVVDQIEHTEYGVFKSYDTIQKYIYSDVKVYPRIPYSEVIIRHGEVRTGTRIETEPFKDSDIIR